ncbi:MAG TPA: hypothetical protein VGD66_12675 [Allosphingosinicella sp.]|jgi:hypothetical protein
MNDETNKQYSTVLQVAVLSFLVSVGVVVAIAYLFPLPREVHLYAANIAVAVVTAYIFGCGLAYSEHSESRRRSDSGFLVRPLPAVLVVLVPCVLNFLYQASIYLSDPALYAANRLAALACMAILLLSLVGIAVSAPLSARETVTEYVTIPVTILSLVVVLGSDRALGYLSDIVPRQLADLNLTLRNVVAGVLGLSLFLDFVLLWFRRGSEFSGIVRNFQAMTPHRANGEVIDQSRGPLTAPDALRLAVFHTLRYPRLVVVIVGKFLIILIQSAVRSIQGLLFTRRFLLGLLFSALILTSLALQNGSPLFLSALATTVSGNAANAQVLLLGALYAAWTATLLFSYAWLCYAHCRGLAASWLLVFSLCLCGLWLASLVLHVAVALGWLPAPGFAFSRANPFFWCVALIGAIGVAIGGRRLWTGELPPAHPEQPAPGAGGSSPSIGKTVLLRR